MHEPADVRQMSNGSSAPSGCADSSTPAGGMACAVGEARRRHNGSGRAVVTASLGAQGIGVRCLFHSALEPSHPLRCRHRIHATDVTRASQRCGNMHTPTISSTDARHRQETHAGPCEGMSECERLRMRVRACMRACVRAGRRVCADVCGRAGVCRCVQSEARGDQALHALTTTRL